MNADSTTAKTKLKAAPGSKNGGNVHQVEVRLKPDFSDTEGTLALALLQEAGLNTARELRTSQIYEIRGPLNMGQVQQAARDLLCDCVTQEFKLVNQTPVLNGMNYWRIEVWLKNSVSDNVGDTVRKAIAEMGLPAPDSVRCAVAYHISGKCGRNHIEKAVQKCLVNPLIHRFTVSEAHA